MLGYGGRYSSSPWTIAKTMVVLFMAGTLSNTAGHEKSWSKNPAEVGLRSAQHEREGSTETDVEVEGAKSREGNPANSARHQLFDYDDYSNFTNWHDSLKVRHRRQQLSKQHQQQRLLNRQSLSDSQHQLIVPTVGPIKCHRKEISTANHTGYKPMRLVGDGHHYNQVSSPEQECFSYVQDVFDSPGFTQEISHPLPGHQLRHPNQYCPGTSAPISSTLQRRSSFLHSEPTQTFEELHSDMHPRHNQQQQPPQRVEVRRVVVGPLVAYGLVAVPLPATYYGLCA
ncbi:hypothetical protein RRG08_064846 [Elysia crispata]|uniref:Uncharacterized protein n=1 Tax=Elysia crispata TaxID=231223 RepID=A0AAE1A3L0_9GAST|nr:hypothetical protein RRG08_064846 [Elysia crispata]